MDIFAVLTLIGGLALFLFGMDTMGDGLVKISGGKLESILERLTQKRIMALLTGAMVTAVIQSSSATTVMVVGFVNSGIMELGQAVGIIMGANVGTTVTSWILSLTGIEGDSIFMRLLKPSSFSPVLAAVGIVLNMTSKEGSRNKDIGRILLGFAVLMFGMETMSGSVAPLADSEEFTSILVKFSNPVMGLLAGAILTAVIQSSSASVGILQALCMTGAVGYSAAIPIIMGQNIGTCVTALISSVGANRNARRASMIHLYFNLIGTILFMIAFYLVNSFVDFAFMEKSAGAAGIAVVHTCFNLGCAVVLFPFANKLVKLAKLTIPDKKENEEGKQLPRGLQALDERFLDNPTFAIGMCYDAVNEMAVQTRESLLLAAEALEEGNREKSAKAKEKEDLVDTYDAHIGAYLLKLSGKGVGRTDSQSMSLLLHCINSLERISDHARNVAETAEAVMEAGQGFSKEAMDDIKVFSRAVKDIVIMTIDILVKMDLENAKNVEPLEEVIDYLCKGMKDRHIARLSAHGCNPQSGMYFEDVVIDLERVSDHCSNIALELIEQEKDEYDPHKYLKNTIKNNTEWFQSRMKEYAEKYTFEDRK